MLYVFLFFNILIIILLTSFFFYYSNYYFTNCLYYSLFKELFGDVGTLVRASLQRPGSAEVYYLRREDASKAVDVYHNRQLDGLPMRCNLGPTYVNEPLNRREVASPQSKSRYSLSEFIAD